MTADDIIDRVEGLRKEKGWTIYKLAEESGVPYSSVYNMFDRKTMPRIDTLEKICNGLQVPVTDVLVADMSKTNGTLSAEEKRLLEIVRQLSRKKRLQLLAYASALAGITIVEYEEEKTEQ